MNNPSALSAVVESILKQPTPEALSKLQPLLLVIDTPEAGAINDVARDFYMYLSAIRNMLTARQFPVLATSLAVTSQSLGMTEEILSPERTNVAKVLTDGLRMALDVLSTYQFVRQWEPGFAAIHDSASWNLYEHYWKLSVDTQPDLSPVKRAELLEELFTLVRNPETDSALRLALLVRLFQWALITRLVRMLDLVKGTAT
ncbi:MAG: hypothetical protein L0154_10780 [Chloroflexi bacterium]|nr:hypothetical protein [Chloroflexota bacterium]